jgi:hypothetical protein
MSDTPRTDAFVADISRGFNAVTEFARELERENAALRAGLKKCHRHLSSEIQRKTLNESAADGTQSLSAEVSRILDSATAP